MAIDYKIIPSVAPLHSSWFSFFYRPFGSRPFVKRLSKLLRTDFHMAMDNTPAAGLDDTGYRRREREREDRDRERDWERESGGGDNESPRGSLRVPNAFVVGFILYLVTSGVGGIWWAATIQNKSETLNEKIIDERLDRAKVEAQLWQTEETYRLQVEALRIDVARVQGGQIVNSNK